MTNDYTNFQNRPRTRPTTGASWATCSPSQTGQTPLVLAMCACRSERQTFLPNVRWPATLCSAPINTRIAVYSLDDVSGDTSFNSFNINNAPSYLYSVLLDIISINPALKARAFILFLHALTPTAGAHSTMEPGQCVDQSKESFTDMLAAARMDENDRNNEWRDDTVEPCLCMCAFFHPADLILR